MWLGILFAVIFLVYYINSFNKETKQKTNNYSNHCFKCGSYINSSKNKRCPSCGWYVCSNCGSCGCEYHE